MFADNVFFFVEHELTWARAEWCFEKYLKVNSLTDSYTLYDRTIKFLIIPVITIILMKIYLQVKKFTIRPLELKFSLDKKTSRL